MAGKLKIGIEAQRIFRREKHGMDIVVLELLKRIKKFDTDFEFFIFAQKNEDDICLTSDKNFTIVQTNKMSYPLWEQWKLPTLVKKYGIDILHCTSNTAPVFPGTKLITTIHDIIYLESFNFRDGTWYQRFGNLYRKLIVPIVAKKSEKIITVSNYEKGRIDKYFGFDSEKTVVISNACSDYFLDDEFSDNDETVNSFKQPYILFLGNTDPKKNMKGVIEALKILHDRDELNFDLVIPDIDNSYLQNIINKYGCDALRDKIIRMSYVPNTALKNIYKNASLFLYPSLRESFGIPILEAMASGTPLITSNTSAMPEIAGEAAEFVDPKNSESIANAITILMNSESTRNELTAKGKRRVTEFSWDKSAQKLLELYESFNK